MDFNYAMGRSTTVMDRSITTYEFMVQGCAGSWEAMMLHMMALSTTVAAYMTLTKAAKEAIWLKGLSIESGAKLMLVAVIATSTLEKRRFPIRGSSTVEAAEYRYSLMVILRWKLLKIVCTLVYYLGRIM
ncbi:subtilisin-like protease SBT1.8 [Artemisia annua]|uniref:Subtilisin-like protease SBT1.8 n=1 Tax=Artemisia annua TaxID=35608 RepID=A0A2U1L853_ARTAN|nr:subtilisin-like protease SBT1.8 [Artemisia annua]